MLRHAFIAWLFMHQRMPIMSRLAKFTEDSTHLTYELCNEAEEDLNHFFLSMPMEHDFLAPNSSVVATFSSVL